MQKPNKEDFLIYNNPLSYDLDYESYSIAMDEYADYLERQRQVKNNDSLYSVSVSSFCRLPKINCFSGICETCGKTH